MVRSNTVMDQGGSRGIFELLLHAQGLSADGVRHWHEWYARIRRHPKGFIRTLVLNK